MIVIYLSNSYIRVVEGESSGRKINARNLYYTVDHNGCILNGTVMDEEGFLDIIENLWDTNQLPKKGISLVIDSSQFTMKVTEVPLQKPKQMKQYISREFADVERISNPVYGYFPLPEQQVHKAKVQTVMSMMAPREFIQNYQQLFGKLGIQIERVECAMGAMARLVGSLSQIRKSTCIVQYVDDMTLINLLVVNGAYAYSSRNRLFLDPGTPGFAVEVARSVNNILQFAQAQNIPERITKVYIAGMQVDDLDIYIDSIRRMNEGLEAEELDPGSDVAVGKVAGGGGVASGFALAIGGMIKTDIKTNIMAEMVKDPEKEAEKRKKRKVFLPIGILGAILILASSVLGGRTLYLYLSLQDVKEYNHRADVLQACEEYEAVSSELKTVNTLRRSINGLKESVLCYPLVDSTVEHTVAACAAGLVSAEIESYDSQAGILSFDTSAANVWQIHQFVALMGQQAIFASVDYTGYAQDSEGQWNVNVNCTMSGRQEVEDDAENDGTR